MFINSALPIRERGVGIIDVIRKTGLSIASVLTLLALPASASSWQAAQSGAVAVLPSPEKAAGIAGATLFCEQQKWSFLVQLQPESQVPEAATPGVLTAGRARFTIEGQPKDGQLLVPLGADMLEPIKTAARMSLAIGDSEESLKAEFSLAASAAVIDAIAPLCSPVDMSAYQRIELGETAGVIEQARGLLADEARLFTEAVGQDPGFSAGEVNLANDRALLFVSLCGSTRYYGQSGCSMFGFARLAADESWRLVYDTEGVQLFLDDRDANAVFPDLLTLPLVGAVKPSRWVWTGATYEPERQATAEADRVEVKAK